MNIWTKITDALPADDWEYVIWFCDRDSNHALGPMPYVDVSDFTHWRPLGENDRPPEDKFSDRRL